MTWLHVTVSPWLARILIAGGAKDSSQHDAVQVPVIESELDLPKVDLHGANLTLANLAGSRLASANLTRATFSNADLTGVAFIKSTMVRAILTDADLTGADLSGADLTDADLSGADLTNVIWTAGVDATSWPKPMAEEMQDRSVEIRSGVWRIIGLEDISVDSDV
jgi:Pentapeptide repeats (8 copies)